MGLYLRDKLTNCLWIFFIVAGQSALASPLGRAYQNFLQNDPEVKVSNLNSQIWQKRLDKANSRLWPSASLSGSTSNTVREQNGLESRFKGETYAVSISQVVYDKTLTLEPARLSALELGAISEFKEAVQVRSLIFIQAYLSWIEAKVQLSLFQRRLAAIEKRRDQVMRLFENSRSDISQVMTVENERDRVVADIARTRSRVSGALSNLRTFVDSKFIFELASTTLPIDRWPLANETLQLIDPGASQDHRVAAAEASRDAIRVEVEQAKAQWLPKVDAALQYKETNVGATDTEVFPTTSTVAQITFAWNFYDSGLRESTLAEAKIKLRESELKLDFVQRRLDSEKESARSDIDGLKESWLAAKAEYESSKKFLEVADRGFELGVGTIGTSLMALERLIDSESRLTSRWLEVILGTYKLAHLNNQLDLELLENLSQISGI